MKLPFILVASALLLGCGGSPSDDKNWELFQELFGYSGEYEMSLTEAKVFVFNRKVATPAKADASTVEQLTAECLSMAISVDNRLPALRESLWRNGLNLSSGNYSPTSYHAVFSFTLDAENYLYTAELYRENNSSAFYAKVMAHPPTGSYIGYNFAELLSHFEWVGEESWTGKTQ